MREYTVSIGHEHVEVKAEDYSSALMAGRKALCERWMRLWDVIMAKPDSAFTVALAIPLDQWPAQFPKANMIIKDEERSLTFDE